LGLRQQRNDWCVSASIEAVLDYYGLQIENFQSYFSSSMQSIGDYNFRNAVKVLKDLKEKNKQSFNGFSFETDSLGFDMLVSKIINSIDIGYPIIVSIPVIGGANMNVFVGAIDDIFMVYDPGVKLSDNSIKFLQCYRLRELIPDGRDYLLIMKEKFDS
jgi:hypothetical protein